MTTTTLFVPQPAVRLNTDVPSEPEQEFRAFLEDNLFGQPEAVDAGTDAYVASMSPLKPANRPLLVVHSLGKSRTGKSELPRLLALRLHGSRDALVRVNLSQYKSSHQIQTLIGAPHSYVGFDKPSKFSRSTLEASRGKSKNKAIILVLEEGEKAHDDVMDVLLGILDNGEGELGNGETVNFRDVIIFITSNLAADKLAKLGKRKLGFGPSQEEAPKPTQTDIVLEVQKALAAHYKPEFLNRIDRTVIYRDLTRGDVGRIVDREIKGFQAAMLATLGEKSQFIFSVDEAGKQFLLDSAMKAAGEFDENTDGSGSSIAELKRLIQRDIIMPLNRELLKRTIGMGDFVTATHVSGETKLALMNAKAAPMPEVVATEGGAAQDKGAAAAEPKVDGKKKTVTREREEGGKEGTRGRRRRRYNRGIPQLAILHYHAEDERDLDEAAAELTDIISDDHMFERIGITVDYQEGTFHAHVVATVETFAELKDAFGDDLVIEIQPTVL